MSQYSWFFVNKNYLLFAILAAALIVPVSYVTADIYFGASSIDVITDGDTGFTVINGVSSIATFVNGTTTYAIVAGYDDKAVLAFDITNPKDISSIASLSAAANGGLASTYGGPALDGVRNIETFTNANGTFAVAVSDFDDSIQIIDLSNPTVALYTTHNYTLAKGGQIGGNEAGSNSGILQMNGAYDVAIFENTTNSRTGPMAIVSSHLGDGVQVFDLRAIKADTETASHMYNGLNYTANGHNYCQGGACQGAIISQGDRLPLDGAAGLATFTATSKYSGDTIPYVIVTAHTDDAIQVLTLRDPMNSSGNNFCTLKHQGGHACGIRAPLNATGVSPYANATDGTKGYNLLNGAIDVDTWTYGAEVYGIVVADVDDSFIILELTDPSFTTGGISAAQLSNSTDNSLFTALDGANSVDVFKIDTRPYALITSNATTSINGVTLVDLYDPRNPQPVEAVFDGQLKDGDDISFSGLEGANDVKHYFDGQYHYAIVVSGGSDTADDAISVIRLTGERTASVSPICGLTKDCSPPSITKHGGTATPDGFTINGANISNQDKYNDVDTITSNVGSLVTLKARVYDDFSLNSIESVILYFDMPGAADWSYSNASIKYSASSGTVTIGDDNNLFNADVSSAVVTNPYGDDSSLELLDVTFKVMFNGPMDTSHIAVQSIDDMGNYQIIYFKDALEVVGQSTSATPTAGEDTINDEVTQTVASVPDWVKNTAGWWAEGQISEGEFVKGVEYLIKQQIIDTDAQTITSEGTGASIPDWVKNTAGWWAEGQISEGEFVNAIEHLVKTGTIIII